MKKQFQIQICLFTAMCGLAISSASAQPLKKKGPISSTDSANAQQASDLDEANQAWAKAMESFDSPYLMISFGIDGGSSERSLGLNLTDDESSYTTGLAAQMESLMMDAYFDTNIIDLAALQASQRRVAADMKDSGLDDMVDRVMRDVNADLAIISQFTALPDNAYRVNVKIVNPSTARRVSVGSYTIKPGVHHIDVIATAMYKEIADKMLKMTQQSAPKRDIVILGDLGDKQLRDLKQHIAGIEGVQNGNKLKSPAKSNNQLILRGVQYDGDPVDLGYEVSDLLAEKYEIRSKLEFSEGNITIRVYENAEAPRWYMLTDTEESELKESFKAYYGERSSNRIAVMFNSYPTGAQTLENQIVQALMDAGVDVTDSARLRELVKPNGQAGTSALSQDEVIKQLRSQGGFDVLIVGDAEQTTTGIPNATLRAVTIENGRLLGASSWPSREATTDPKYGVDKDDPQMSKVARFLAGSILDSYYRNQLVKGSSFDIKVDGVISFAQANFIATSIESVVPNVLSVSNVRYTDGEASFSLKFEGDIKKLLQALQQKTSELPIQSEITDAGAGSLTLRAKPLENDG